MNKIGLIFVLTFIGLFLKAQSKEDILTLLIDKKILTQQTVDSLKNEIALKKSNTEQYLKISGEIKPRFEIRNGYGNQSLPSSEKVPAVFVNQRTRLNFEYQYLNILNTYLSIQDARIWGMKDPRGLNGTLQLFEAYVEPFINKNLSIKIGRQRFMLDNQRLFAENEWRVNASAHDAIKINYSSSNKEKLSTDLFAAWNQTFERFYGTDLTTFNNNTSPNSLENSFQPNGTSNTWENQWYKGLFVHHLLYKINSNFKLTAIQVADIFQAKNSSLNTSGSTSAYVSANPEKHFTRFTNGGRIDFEKNNWELTFSGYYQSGKNRIGKKINAFYFQPEIKFKKEDNYNIRIGAEIISGDGNTDQLTNSVDGNFDTLYGVAHRFNGFIDLFTNFYSGSYENGIASSGNHLKNNGLINPYLFLSKTINNKLELNLQNHLFWLQHNYISGNTKYNKYLGFETDLLLKYKPNKITDIELGYSYVFAQNSLAAIKGNNLAVSYQNPQWLYLQLKVTPTFFEAKF